MEVPMIKNQTDFLREQIRDRKLAEYQKCIDVCLQQVQEQKMRKIDKDELQELINEGIGEELD